MRWIFVSFFLLTSYFLPPTSVNAQSVDILWQGETYTPPFYQGRALWSRQSRATLVAIPQGLGNPANLDYIWMKNGTILGNISGIGKNSLTFMDTIFSKRVTIKVEIVRGDDELLAEASIILTPFPQVLTIYENNPLYGFLFHQEVSDAYPLREAEVTFSVFPLFFNTQNHSDAILTYEWRTNTDEAETGSSVTYRIPEKASGTSLISVALTNINQIMQSANKSFLVQFGNENE
ncbi:MAG: hypothetical protein EXS69_01400 [Candidatus Zambryskibacteria bacterium]|nr:hypothetical protein [Candidatus Zambryskibacteria bacterium]